MKNIKKELKGALSEEKLAEIKKKISESLAIDRHSLICNFPFTGAISMRLDLIPVRDKRCRTACTDGKSIFYDCEFYSKLNKKERVFVLAHEIWHCVLLHLSRCQTRNKELFNIATDMEVNNLLVENSNNGKFIVPPKKVLFPPDKLKGKSAEVIYEWLMKKANKSSKNKDGDSDDDTNDSMSSSKSSKSFSGKKNSSKSYSDIKDELDQNSENDSSNGLSGQFDKHTYTDDNGDGDVDDKITDRWGEVGYDDDFRPFVPEDIAEKMREASIAAAQQCQREKGTLPVGIESIINKVQKPEINWREYLSQFVSSCYNGARKWLPPNRRHIYNDTYFQSRRGEKIEGVVAIDTSGSCIGDLPKFFGELKGLVDAFGNYRITVICADAAVDQVDIYDQDDNPLDFDSDEKIKWSGGGGTDYGPVFKYVDKNNIKPDFLIYVGDGFADLSYDKVPNYPVMWLLTKDGDDKFCDWGKKIWFKESSYDY